MKKARIAMRAFAYSRKVRRPPGGVGGASKDSRQKLLFHSRPRRVTL